MKEIWGRGPSEIERTAIIYAVLIAGLFWSPSPLPGISRIGGTVSQLGNHGFELSYS
jgi:hypothetical protein